MNRVILYGMIILVIIILTACGTNGSGSNNSLINMKIMVTADQTAPSKNIRLAASFNEAVINQESWFLFEIRRSDGPTWVRAQNEGKGVFAAEINQLQGNYELYGHLYAGGGFHFSRKYSPIDQ